MESEKIFDLMEKMYADLKDGQDNLKKGQDDLSSRLANVEKTVIKIENEHGEKLNALFDGYKQNSEQLNRIEHEVAKHEEVILRRIK
ncbi:hypothetical protein CLLI_22070 [Clostridium liquoris]|uniref:Uncharacterized protein n=1 Tax=Clostridium liquoris TaxID=1289519 RepID=A0A2T0B1F6_9CLOT|nr:hypothetical protein [Clostridium liquoris]PRR77643.1 hypothetical protein CLLI_22070 [Clostridium liquoris]